MTEELTPERLAEIRARHAAATPGPWSAVELPPNEHSRHPAYWVKAEYSIGEGTEDEATVSEVVASCLWSMDDARFIGHARQDVDALLAGVERLRRKVDQAHTNAECWQGRYRAEARTYWDDELPPGGECCADCGQPVESEPCPEHHPGTLVEQLRAELAPMLTRAAVLEEAAGIAERVGRRVYQDAPLENRAEGAWETAAELRRVASAPTVTEVRTTAVPSEPVQLRWGLGDVEWGDDGSVTVLLSGPGGIPAVLELDASRAAALRDDLPVAGPATDAGYAPALPWAAEMDDEDLGDMLDGLADASVANLPAGERLAHVECVLADARLTAEIDRAQATAPGADAPAPNPADATMGGEVR